MRRRGTAVAVACAVAAVLLPALPAAASPTAQTSAEDLVSFLTKGKLKPGKRIAFRFVCSEDCFVTATSTLVLKGPNLGPIASSGQFPAGQIIEAFLKPNRPARDAIKDNIGASKLRTSVTATSTGTGETDTDNRTFKFKG
jgi:hypothetical protein